MSCTIRQQSRLVKDSQVVLLHLTAQTWESFGKLCLDLMSHGVYYLSNRFFSIALAFLFMSNVK